MLGGTFEYRDFQGSFQTIGRHILRSDAQIIVSYATDISLAHVKPKTSAIQPQK